MDVIDIITTLARIKPKKLCNITALFFDKTYIHPEANGVKRVNGNWDASQNKEYIFARCQEWLAKYMGTNHGVTLGMTETGINSSILPSVTAVWYASTMGEFMRNGVEIFHTMELAKRHVGDTALVQSLQSINSNGRYIIR